MATTRVQVSNFGKESSFTYHNHCEIYNFHQHIHQYAELVIIEDGELFVTVDGEEWRAGSGDFILIFPFQPHSYRSEQVSRFQIYTFSPSLVSDFFESCRGSVPERGVFPASDASYRLFLSRLKEKKDFSKYSIICCLYSMLADFASSMKLKPDSSDKQLIGRLVSYVSDNLKSPLPLSEVAKSIGYSSNYLSHCIKRAFGFGYCRLLGILRTEQAKTYLSSTKLSAIEIAIECGFGCERSFHRQFREVTGISPREYRRGSRMRIVNHDLLY